MSYSTRWFSTADLLAVVSNFTFIDRQTAIHQLCVAVRFDEQDWVIFGRIPTEHDLSWISYLTDQPFQVGQVQPEAMLSFMALLNGQQNNLPNQKTGHSQNHISEQSLVEEDSQIIRVVNTAIFDAYHKGASDIHFENNPEGLVIKCRIDGVLVETGKLYERTSAEHVISRLKVLAELDIAERRIPQDGRLSIQIQGRDIDLRISIMPGLHGEDAVLRILDKQSLTQGDEPLSLELLGFDVATMVAIRKLARQPYGMLLVTGPTGSGKTTTLYALLNEHHTGQQKIITIEDPVEYQLKGTLQIPVNERKGLTFARGLRSILRHDPDTILVGEIRDRETADIAVQAALTGHLVYTSVHANHSLDVIGRFRHMEIDLFGFVSSLNGIVAQRLIRLNCTHCSEPTQPDRDLIHFSGITLEQAEGFHFQEGKGCDECQGTGYRGRQAIAEVLVINDAVREMLILQEPISRIREYLLQSGMFFLRQQALAVVAEGRSTLQEINRVTFVQQ
ncbi:GspE/PulE family protein [Aquirhabdus parva]|uniref:Type II/IV secretion system protein n=1 Tax=Aquirhabdus parva TaxID=2283318 RepID=A0A345P2H1_9GAMM|nr:GspE/PulE family protein [Aquirhabdus parva]AXI01480.1 type II/IV secretion system protein [Aquirhabdus parva]